MACNSAAVKLVLAGAQRGHRRRDGGLRRGTGPTAGRVEPALGFSDRLAGADKILRQKADLFGIQASVNAFHQTVVRAVAGDFVLIMVDFDPEFPDTLLESQPRAFITAP